MVAKKTAYVSEWKVAANGVRVHKSNHAFGGLEYSAWEPSAPMSKHSTITTCDTEDGPCGTSGRRYEWLGRLGTRALTPEIDALRGGSPERIAACDAYRAAQHAVAVAAIVECFPEAAEAAHGPKARGALDGEVLVAEVQS